MVQNQLIRRGIESKKVLDAFSVVPRHIFVPKAYQDWAYNDFPLSIGQQQTISQPYIVALMTEALDIKATDIILEIGTGSGYQTAILAILAKKVYTIERLTGLQNQAKKTLEKLNVDNIVYRVSDGSLGWREQAPFDKIIVTAACKSIPEELLSELKEEGLLVAPCGNDLIQELLLIKKRGHYYDKKNLCACRFVPLVTSRRR